MQGDPLWEVIDSVEFMASIDRRTYAPAPVGHRHDFYQLVLPRRGELVMSFEAAEGVVRPGVMCVAAPGEWHRFHGRGENEFLILDVPSATVEDVALDLGLPGPTPLRGPFRPVDDRLATLTAVLETESREGSLTQHLLAETLCRYILAHLLRTGAPAGARSLTPPRCGDRRLARALAYMQTAYDENLTLAGIAQVAGVSPAHLCRLFQAHLSASPLQYLNRLRLQQARQLLRSSDLPLVEVALAVGFGSQSYFQRLFKAVTGVTPAAYRRQR